jgi:hypothetical protein
MKNQHIARLEAHLEQLIEGTFASLFGKKIKAQDIALQLAREMESGLQAPRGSDPRPVAPNQYVIYLHPAMHQQLLDTNPELAHALGEHMVELATQAGYRIEGLPLVKLLADAELETGKVMVTAHHSERHTSSTAAMQRVELPPINMPTNPHFIVDGTHTVSLRDEVVNIGRSRVNHIVLSDPYVSRHHTQLRLRYGAYILFDVRSQGGTFVNGVQVKEHRLQSGDVIRIGNTQLVYVEDEPAGSVPLTQTQPLDPL